MGGKLIVDISQMNFLIISKISDYSYRLMLAWKFYVSICPLHQFEILDEDIVKDAHHIYEIMVCQKDIKTHLSYQEE